MGVRQRKCPGWFRCDGIMRAVRTTLLVTISIFFVSASQCDGLRSYGVFHCYLTWQGDTGTTMTVNYHTGTDSLSQVLYDLEPRHRTPEAYRFRAFGTSHRIEGLASWPGGDRVIHTVELTGLTPGETYYFIAGSRKAGFTEEKAFRTIPDDGGPLRFVVGGDMGVEDAAIDLVTHAAAASPQFAIIGGDIAYSDGQLWQWRDWDLWLENWERWMVTPDGLTVPLVLAIGNHEVNGGMFQFADPLGKAPFYFGYFAQRGHGFEADRRTYFARQFGADVLVVILDTAHVTPLGGAQSRWLEETLAAASGIEHVFAAYHVPMYPSHRQFSGLWSMSEAVRVHWRPLFDAYGLTAAFEHHDHMFKRTKRLRNDVPHPDGTLYLGDGCFGRSPRVGDQALALEDPATVESLGLSENYLAAWGSRRHFWLVDIPAQQEDGIHFTAMDEMGEAFDEYTLPGRGL